MYVNTNMINHDTIHIKLKNSVNVDKGFGLLRGLTSSLQTAFQHRNEGCQTTYVYFCIINLYIYIYICIYVCVHTYICIYIYMCI